MKVLLITLVLVILYNNVFATKIKMKNFLSLTDDKEENKSEENDQESSCPKTCGKDSNLDVMLLLDTSGSLGSKGFDAVKFLGRNLVKAFTCESKNNKISIIDFSGPRTWGGIRKCFGNFKKSYRAGSSLSDTFLSSTCSIDTMNSLSEDHDMEEYLEIADSLEWGKGSTLTSLAMMRAMQELTKKGRKDSEKVMIVVTDGRPISYHATRMASSMIQKLGIRLVWVPITRHAPLRYIKRWASKPWKHNVVPVKTFTKLKQGSEEITTNILADICSAQD